MNLTSVDPPEVIRFVRRQYPDVELVKPQCSIFQRAVERTILPSMRVRWCCEDFKESAGAGKVTLIGIRHEESARRAARNEVEIDSRKFSGTLEGLDEYHKELDKPKRGRKAERLSIVTADGERTLGCITGKESLLISPIIHWTSKDVWEFVNAIGASHCELYDQGWTRIGCIGCPMSSMKTKIKENERWPHVKRNWIKAIMQIRAGVYAKDNTLPKNNPEISALWGGAEKLRGMGLQGFSDGSSPDGTDEEQERQIAENIYDWWISGKSYKRWYAEKFLQQKFNFKDE